jgi:hypothetical protein
MLLAILTHFVLWNLIGTIGAMMNNEDKERYIIRLLFTNLVCSIFVGCIIIPGI